MRINPNNFCSDPIYSPVSTPIAHRKIFSYYIPCITTAQVNIEKFVYLLQFIPALNIGLRVEPALKLLPEGFCYLELFVDRRPYPHEAHQPGQRKSDQQDQWRRVKRPGPKQDSRYPYQSAGDRSEEAARQF